MPKMPASMLMTAIAAAVVARGAGAKSDGIRSGWGRLLPCQPAILSQEVALLFLVLFQPHFCIAEVVKALGWRVLGLEDEPDTPVQMSYEGEDAGRCHRMLHFLFTLHPVQHRHSASCHLQSDLVVRTLIYRDFQQKYLPGHFASWQYTDMLLHSNILHLTSLLTGTTSVVVPRSPDGTYMMRLDIATQAQNESRCTAQHSALPISVPQQVLGLRPHFALTLVRGGRATHDHTLSNKSLERPMAL